MKGYYISCGYMGWICGKYRLFSTEKEYEEIYKESLREEFYNEI